MERAITKQTLISYLQSMMDYFMEQRAQFGADDRMVHKTMLDMIACKEMVEALIREPVNLQLDGKVTVGF